MTVQWTIEDQKDPPVSASPRRISPQALPSCKLRTSDMASEAAINLFEKLRVEFDLDQKVTKWLTSPKGLAAKSLEDFLCACTEEGVQDLVEAADPDNVFLATSRMRQAWRSLKRARDNDEAIIRSGNDAMDMDDLLAISVLDDIEARHWARYKMTWPPDIAPADTVI